MTRPARWPIVVALMTMAALLGLWFLAIERGGPAHSAATVGLRSIDLAPLTATGSSDAMPQATEAEAAAAESEPVIDPAAPATTTVAPERSAGFGEARSGEVPTATPLQLPTGAPLEWILAEAATRVGVDALDVPAAGCVSVDSAQSVLDLASMPHPYRCPAGGVTVVAPGRVIMVGDPSEQEPLADPRAIDAPWDWRRGLELGRFVVIDHGPIGSAQSAISVYSRLGEVEASLQVGTEVDAGQRLAALRPATAEGEPGANAEFMWELWVDGDLEPATFQVEAATALRWAAALAANGAAPVDQACGFPYGVADLLPNSPRPYRSGVHRGVDFNCGRGNDAYAYADGQVVFAVRNFDEPTVAQREATLRNAASAGSTPHWILAMLYGNFVVIDHGVVPGVGQVVTISAHLDSVDPAITLGATVSAGQRLGEVGNAGTNAGASGTERTIHLHWELFVDGTHLAAGLAANDTSEIYRALLCGVPEALNGC